MTMPSKYEDLGSSLKIVLTFPRLLGLYLGIIFLVRGCRNKRILFQGHRALMLGVATIDLSHR